MKKKYTVKFIELDGKEYEFEFLTEDIEKAISEYCRNRPIQSHEILTEDTSNKKTMLFG